MGLRSPGVLIVLCALGCSTAFEGGSDAGVTSGASGSAGASTGGSSAGGASGVSGGTGGVGGTSGGSGGAAGSTSGKGGTAGTGGVAGAGGKAGSAGTGGSAGASGSAAGGAGGKAGNAGAGGNAGKGVAGAGGVAGGAGGGGGKDGGSADIATDRAIDDCGCVGEGIVWGPNGGHVAYVDTSSLSPCKTFGHHRNPVLTDPITLMCMQELGACATSITPAQIAQALAHSDVQAAIAAAPVLYGQDMRPVDGTVLRIMIGNGTVEVGSPCAGMAGCTPIPVGIEALATLLRNLTLQELERPPCRDTFRPG